MGGGVCRSHWHSPSLLPLPLPLLLLLLLAFDLRAVKRAEHRRAAGPKSSPCLSAASLGCGTVKVPMCPADREAQGTAAASCGGSRPAKGLFGSFLVLQKGTRTRSGRKLCTSSAFASFTAVARFRVVREEQSFRAVRAAYFCLVKSKHDSADALANGEAGPKGERRRRESNRHRRTRADAAAPRRSPALLA